MALSLFKHVKIKGISTVVPTREINIYDEAHYYDNNIKKIDRMRKVVGFHTRRVVDAGTTASDLCINAAEILFKEMNVNKDSIDALVFVVQRPDHDIPATAYYIHNKLGLSENCIALDIRQGCPGWVYGLNMVHTMIESGAYKRVLLLAGDTPSAGINVEDRNVAPVFGDGGSATLLEYSEEENDAYFNITVHSDGYESIIKPASGYRLPLKHNDEDKELLEYIENPNGNKNRLVDFHLEGIAVFNFTMSCVPQNIEELIKYASVEKQDIDYFMSHQANKQIVNTISSAIGFEQEKAPTASFENLGNQSITSIPISMSFSISDKLSNQKNKILCSGFGNGLAVASCILNTDNIYCSGVRDYENKDKEMTKEEYILYWKNKIKGEN